MANNPLQLTDVLGLAEGSEQSAGPEPVSPVAEEEYTQKLEEVIAHTVARLKGTTVEDAAGKVLKEIKDAAKGLALIALGGAVAVGGAVLAGVAAPVAVGVVVSAIGVFGVASAGWAGIIFIKDLISLAFDIGKLSPCQSKRKNDVARLGDNLFDLLDRAGTETLLAVATLGIGKAAHRVGKALEKPPKASSCSFAAETLVLTSAGYVAIEQIEAGNDEVWSKNATTGEMGWKPVIAQYSNPYDQTVNVMLRSHDGLEQTISSNAIHPYFVQLPENVAVRRSSEGHVYRGEIANGAWVDAASLKPGFELLSDDQSWQSVVAVNIQDKPLTAFNLTVADFSTYFVAANEDADAVWVHNNCFTSLPEGFRKSGKNEHGQDVYEGPGGEKLYKSDDGRFYDPEVYPPGKDYDPRGLDKQQEDYYRKKIDEAEVNGDLARADDWRYARHVTAKENQGQKPLSRDVWEGKNQRLRDARNKGRENENKARDALGDFKGEGNARNNNFAVKDKDGKVIKSPDTYDTPEGKTTRPDTVTDKYIQEHKHFQEGTDGQVVYNSDQIKGQREAAKKDGKEHVITISSDAPKGADGQPKPRPSREFSKEENRSTIYYVENGKVTHEWNPDLQQWDSV
mgnify:FL=1